MQWNNDTSFNFSLMSNSRMKSQKLISNPLKTIFTHHLLFQIPHSYPHLLTLILIHLTRKRWVNCYRKCSGCDLKEGTICVNRCGLKRHRLALCLTQGSSSLFIRSLDLLEVLKGLPSSCSIYDHMCYNCCSLNQTPLFTSPLGCPEYRTSDNRIKVSWCLPRTFHR